MDRLKLLIHEKYGLVHVPGENRVAKWLALTRTHLKTGVPPEQAGLLAARLTFPYELKEHRVHSSTPVTELLGLADALHAPKNGRSPA